MKENIKLKIFNKNINNKYKLVPLNIKLSDYRNKYEAPTYKEWRNTIYSFYKNKTKNISVNHINLNKIIKSYFNSNFLRKHIYLKNMSKKRRLSLLRRIHVSNVEIKQTSNKAVITLYVINTERKRMTTRYLIVEVYKRIKILSYELIDFLIKEIYIHHENKINLKIWKDFKTFLMKCDKGYTIGYIFKGKLYKKIFSFSRDFNSCLIKLKSFLKKRSFISNLSKIKDYKFNRFMWFYFFEIKGYYLKYLLYNLKYKDSNFESYHEIKLKNKINELQRKFEEWKSYIKFLEELHIRSKDSYEIIDKQHQILNSNVFDINYRNYKKYSYPYKLFIKKLDKTYFYFYKLNDLFMKILNKKIEFNIINLKSLVFNSDIFTKALALKLRKKKFFPVMKGIGSIINRAKLPKANTVVERANLKKYKDLKLVHNKYKDSNLLNNNKLFLNLFYYIKNIERENKIFELLSEEQKEEIIFKSLSNSIKHKNMGGIRLEVKGRLTRRYRADRAIYKLKWRGSLKNIESSFNKLSSVVYRGYCKPNLTYSIFKSKRRVGAFAVKGWISGK